MNECKSVSYAYTRTTDTQWRHESKKSVNLGWCGRQNMLRPYLKIWEWELIFSRAVKGISSPGVRSQWSSPVPIYIPLRKREWEFIKNTPESSRVCFSDGQGDNKGWLVVWKVDRWLTKVPTIFNIICWVVGTNDSWAKRLMFQVLFSIHNFLQNRFNLFLLFFQKFTKIKSFEHRRSI